MAFPRSQPPLACRGRRALAWFAGWLIVAHVALSVWIEWGDPSLRDPEFGRKLELLRDRIAEAPQRPLAVVLGSSRSGMGIRPRAMPASDRDRTPLVFNFAITGSGPIHELMFLRRLLDAGIRPQQLFLEVHPLLLHQENGYGEECWLNVLRLQRRDLDLLARYHHEPAAVRRQWWTTRLMPWHAYRFCLLSRYAPDWVGDSSRQDGWTRLDGSGWLPSHQTLLTAEQYRRGLEAARQQYAPAFRGFRISAAPDRALREILEVCRHEEIAVALYLMPEGSEFRSCYSAGARRCLDNYLASLSRDYGVPFFDGTLWSPDDDFTDGHHLLPRGADAFSGRFAREVVQPLVAQKPSARLLTTRRRDTSQPSEETHH